MERLPFSGRMTEILQGSDLNEIVNEMLVHIKTQIKKPRIVRKRILDLIEFYF